MTTVLGLVMMLMALLSVAVFVRFYAVVMMMMMMLLLMMMLMIGFR